MLNLSSSVLSEEFALKENKNESELWDELAPKNHFEILGSMIRSELKRETVKRLDLSYIGKIINEWWVTRDQNACESSLYLQLKVLIIENSNTNDLKSIKGVGSIESHTAAVLLDHVFHIPDKTLAKFVHEAIAEIAGIVDIKYPYEDHKELFPKNDDKITSDWGRGLGIIRPHSDDLYEDLPINAMCLTVCKDITRTPTWFWLLFDVVACLTDSELGQFALADAYFLSGKNVNGRTIRVNKPVLRRDPIEGIGMRIDFRVDDEVGPRMRFYDIDIQSIFNKMKLGLKAIKPIASNPTTGSIGILSNYKILHGRSSLNPAMLYEGESSRILFRSKGTKQEQL